MTSIANVSAGDYLRRGYFPAEMPPDFSTASFAKLRLKPPGVPRQTHCVHYRIARPGGTTRTLSLPNPISMLSLAHAVANAGAEIDVILEGSQIAQSRPVRGTRRAAESLRRISDWPRFSLAARASHRWVAVADISACYASLYTHVIPWALHGKHAAKQNKRGPSAGNAIDAALRSCQDGQTKGVPTGPDTSFVIGELVLSRVDAAIAKVAGARNAFRFVDDYELCFTDEREAHAGRELLQRELEGYELTLSSTKTTVRELPSPIERGWVLAVDGLRLEDDPDVIVRYVEEVFKLSSVHTKGRVMRHAVARVAEWLTKTKQTLSSVTAEILGDFLLHCVATQVSVLPYVGQTASKAMSPGRRKPWGKRFWDAFPEVLSQHLMKQCSLGCSDEVAWCLSIARRYKLTLDSSAARALKDVGDCAVRCLAYVYAHEYGFGSDLDSARWKQVSAGDLTSSTWLWAYQAWQAGLVHFHERDVLPEFRAMRDAQVSFVRGMAEVLPEDWDRDDWDVVDAIY